MSTYYISASSGNDANPGTLVAPWQTLQRSASAVVAGDTVVVMIGTYTQGLNLHTHAGGTAGAPITYLADIGVTITGGNVGPNAGVAGINIELSGGYFVVDGFKVTGTTDMTKAGVRVAHTPNCTVRNCEVDGAFTGVFCSVADGVLVEDNHCHHSVGEHGVYINGTDGYTARRNNCHDCNWDGIHLNIAVFQNEINRNGVVEDNDCHNNTLTGIDIDGCTDTVFRNNRSYLNDKHGATVYNGNEIATPASRNLTFVNEVYWGNGQFGIQFQAGNMDGCVVFNCYLSGGNTGTYGAIGTNGTPPASFRSDYNAVQDRFSRNLGNGPLENLVEWRAATGQDAHSFVATAAAAFTDAASGDFTQAVGSPLIDAGTSGLAGRFVAALDAADTQRPQGTRFDVGVFEATGTHAAPAAPSGLVAVPADPYSANLTWTNNAANDYAIEVQRNGVTVATIAGATTEYVDPGLTTGASYSYRVRASNVWGTSALSAASSMTGPDTPSTPGAPTALTATPFSHRYVDLAWINGAGTRTAVHVERRDMSLGGTFAVAASLASGATTYRDGPTSPTTRYAYRLRSENATVFSDYSDEVQAVTPRIAIGTYRLDPTPGADASDGNPINLGFKFTADSDGLLKGVRFYKHAANTGTHVAKAWGPDNLEKATATFVGETASGWQEVLFASPLAVVRGESWRVSVYMESTHLSFLDGYHTAERTAGPVVAPVDNAWFIYYAADLPSTASPTHASYGVDVVFEVLSAVPSAPSGLVLDGTTLRWVDQSTDETEFRIERSVNGGAFSLLSTRPPATVSYSIVFPAVGSYHQYRVRAANEAGASDPSNIVEVQGGANPSIPPGGGSSGSSGGASAGGTGIKMGHDLLSGASDWLRLQRKRHAASDVVYVRGEVSSLTLRAAKGVTSFDVDGGGDDAAMPVTVRSSDFLIDVEDLSLDGVPVTPQRGDKVIEGAIDDGVEFEVMSPDVSSPPWRYSDPYRRTYRIHTKQVGTRPPG